MNPVHRMRQTKATTRWRGRKLRKKLRLPEQVKMLSKLAVLRSLTSSRRKMTLVPLLICVIRVSNPLSFYIDSEIKL